VGSASILAASASTGQAAYQCRYSKPVAYRSREQRAAWKLRHADAAPTAGRPEARADIIGRCRNVRRAPDGCGVGQLHDHKRIDEQSVVPVQTGQAATVMHQASIPSGPSSRNDMAAGYR
jgi:hypothetical protein